MYFLCVTFSWIVSSLRLIIIMLSVPLLPKPTVGIAFQVHFLAPGTVQSKLPSIEEPWLWSRCFTEVTSLTPITSQCGRDCFFCFSFIFISWRLITSQHFSGFCHTLTWISHGVTCIPHPDPPSHLPLHPIPLGLPSAPGPSTCLMHPTWAGDLFHYR